MSTITLQHLLDACSPGGASVLTSVTPLGACGRPSCLGRSGQVRLRQQVRVRL